MSAFGFHDADREVERKARQVEWAKAQADDQSAGNFDWDDDPRTTDVSGNVTGEDDQAFFSACGMDD